ncbi:MAG: hypothetical protein SFU53_06480 [Terrimicrobiaceae bacterium]|nr:hypothetical protein [Terrimicrobiaceae bacterium]
MSTSRTGPLIGGLFGLMALLLVGVFVFGPRSIEPVQKRKTDEIVRPAAVQSGSPETLEPARTTAAPEAVDADAAISNLLVDPSLTHGQIVGRLLELIPTFSEDDQANAAQHVANLSDDETTGLWIPKIVDRSLPEPAARVLVADLYNRSHDLLLPLLATLADDPRSPFAKESAETLEVLIGPREGEGTWTANVRTWKASQPVEAP